MGALDTLYTLTLAALIKHAGPAGSTDEEYENLVNMAKRPGRAGDVAREQLKRFQDYEAGKSTPAGGSAFGGAGQAAQAISPAFNSMVRDVIPGGLVGASQGLVNYGDVAGTASAAAGGAAGGLGGGLLGTGLERLVQALSSNPKLHAAAELAPLLGGILGSQYGARTAPEAIGYKDPTEDDLEGKEMAPDRTNRMIGSLAGTLGGLAAFPLGGLAGAMIGKRLFPGDIGRIMSSAGLGMMASPAIGSIGGAGLGEVYNRAYDVERGNVMQQPQPPRRQAPQGPTGGPRDQDGDGRVFDGTSQERGA